MRRFTRQWRIETTSYYNKRTSIFSNRMFLSSLPPSIFIISPYSGILKLYVSAYRIANRYQRRRKTWPRAGVTSPSIDRNLVEIFRPNGKSDKEKKPRYRVRGVHFANYDRAASARTYKYARFAANPCTSWNILGE